MLTYDEESAEADNVNIYKIDLNTNRFRKEVSNNEKAYKSANDKETAFIKELYPMTHHPVPFLQRQIRGQTTVCQLG